MKGSRFWGRAFNIQEGGMEKGRVYTLHTTKVEPESTRIRLSGLG
jgi:hypothetical protein